VQRCRTVVDHVRVPIQPEPMYATAAPVYAPQPVYVQPRPFIYRHDLWSCSLNTAITQCQLSVTASAGVVGITGANTTAITTTMTTDCPLSIHGKRKAPRKAANVGVPPILLGTDGLHEAMQVCDAFTMASEAGGRRAFSGCESRPKM
jgi:hypothetical protein